MAIPEKQVPAVHHRRIGDMTVTTVSDGYLDGSMAVIRKQPSPVIVTTCRPMWTRWAPRAAGIDQPIAWLSVGLK